MEPTSIEAAEGELAVHQSWMSDFQQRQAEAPDRLVRVAYLQGWLAGVKHTEEPDD